MTAITFEQIIADHGDMLHRLYDAEPKPLTPAEFMTLIADVRHSYSHGLCSNRDLTRELGLAERLLNEAHDQPDGPAKTKLLHRADRHLHAVDSLALA